MKPVDVILIIIIAGVMIMAIAIMIRNKRHGRSCCNSCGSCCDDPRNKHNKPCE